MHIKHSVRMAKHGKVSIPDVILSHFKGKLPTRLLFKWSHRHFFRCYISASHALGVSLLDAFTAKFMIWYNEGQWGVDFNATADAQC